MNQFATDLINWQRQYGRHDLPWQAHHHQPMTAAAIHYRTWLSEIMLQQTQVTTVIPYFERFLAAFPDLESLATAPLEAVIPYWAGLGYYARARNLHAAARQVMQQYDGQFPDKLADLMSLPGIGRSTAAAIAVFAGGQRAAILDGNVKRILCRCFKISGTPSECEQKLWQLAESLLPELSELPKLTELPELSMSASFSAEDGQARMASSVVASTYAPTSLIAYTQGLMDLGSQICLRKKPKCEQCPQQQRCLAHLHHCVAQYPAAKVRKDLPQVSRRYVLFIEQDEVLLCRRPAKGIWGGLLVPPEIVLDIDFKQWLLEYIGKLGLNLVDSTVISEKPTEFMPTQWQDLVPLAHRFTHFKLTLQPRRVNVRRSALPLPEGWQWFNFSNLNKRSPPPPIPTPIKRMLANISE